MGGVSVPAAPSAPAAWRHAGLVTALIALIVVIAPTGTWRPAAEIPIYLCGLAAAHSALRRHHTTSSLTWRGIGATLLLTALRAPMELAGRTITVTASIGGALAAPGDTAERLLHSADTAMYSAKRTGRDSRALLDVLPG
jgi:hypothetical protein